MNYREYLKSQHWMWMKALVLREKGRHCALCGSKYKLEVHHNNYKRLGKERLSDLVVLCHACHSKHHDKMDTSAILAKVKSNQGELFE